ncbi:hypothetical protein B0H21DRAFT_766404 [Amylocystis lapponica]|nr:hypothetical protein B0H21DRAFT_766404 [Amylocystis lapponica]
MVDGKEREGIVRWVDARRRRFARRDPSPWAGAAAAEDASDADDSDFEDDASSDGGSATSGSSESGSAATSDGLGSESGADDADAELDPEHHPLLRPGAMPLMSRAAIDAVVGMMEEDMMGGGTAMAENESDEEDELDD